MKDKREFSKEEIDKAVSNSRSYRELANKLGYDITSGHYTTDVKKWIEKYNCDTSHFKGKGWSKGNYNFERFESKKTFRGSELLQFLLKGEGRPFQCSCCKNSEWNGKPISLQVHHIDGNHYNNDLDNLQILCPNCHAQTDTYCGKNAEKSKIPDEDYIKAINSSYSIAEALRNLGVRDIPRYRDKIKELIENRSASLLIKEKKVKEERIKKEKKVSNFRKLREEEFKKRKEYFLNSDIDFTKYGWQTKVEKELGISHTQVRRWLKKYMPEFPVLLRNR